VAAVVAGAAGIVAGPGNAAPAPKVNKASHVRKEAKFKHPTLKHGLLTIEGTKGSDRIALRLKAGQSGILQVDVRDDGSADFSFKREQIAKVAVNAGAGNDRVRINERNGVFTNRIPHPVGERQPAEVLPRPRHHHDGHARRGAGRLQRPRRRRHDHRQRPDRHGCEVRQYRPRGDRRRRPPSWGPAEAALVAD